MIRQEGGGDRSFGLRGLEPDQLDMLMLACPPMLSVALHLLADQTLFHQDSSIMMEWDWDKPEQQLRQTGSTTKVLAKPWLGCY